MTSSGGVSQMMTSSGVVSQMMTSWVVCSRVTQDRRGGSFFNVDFLLQPPCCPCDSLAPPWGRTGFSLQSAFESGSSRAGLLLLRGRFTAPPPVMFILSVCMLQWSWWCQNTASDITEKHKTSHPSDASDWSKLNPKVPENELICSRHLKCVSFQNKVVLTLCHCTINLHMTRPSNVSTDPVFKTDPDSSKVSWNQLFLPENFSWHQKKQKLKVFNKKVWTLVLVSQDATLQFSDIR